MAGLAGLCVLFLGMAVAGLVSGHDDATRQRLRHLSGLKKDTSAASIWQRLRRAVTIVLSRLAKPARPRQDWQESQVRAKLLQAGFQQPSSVNVFLGLKVVSLILGAAAAMFLPLPAQMGLLPRIIAMVGLACLGYLLPGFILEARIRSRRKAITRELPDVLDLLVISVEAGLGLDQAIRRVADEVALSCPTLGMEFNLVSLELRAGIPRAMALKNLAARCGVEEVGGLVAMLLQADRFGVSVGRSLRVHSDTVRDKRRQQLEEAAAKIPLKLLFPVLFMIFPAIMVVMAGPAVIRVSNSLFN